MVYTTEKELNKSLKEGLARVYLLYGEDRYLIEQYAALLVKRALGGGESTFDLDRLDGKKPDFDALADSVLALPMLAENRCILIEDPDVERMSAGDLDRLCAALREVGEGTVAVVTVKGEFLPKKSAKCKKLRALCDELGVVAELGARTTGDLAKAVVKRLSAVGAQISPEDARYLVERTTGEVSAVNAEADKLAAYAGTGAAITREAIDRLVPATVEAEIFGLSKAILGRDYPRAMGILENLLYLREPAVNILYTLSAAFIDLYRAKAAVFADVEPPAVAATFGYKGREFVVKNAMRDSRKLELGYLKGALEVLLEADGQLKGSRLPEEIVLQQAVTRLFWLMEGVHG